MIKLLVFVGATIGGAIGWWLGAFIGTMTAFMVSIVGTAAGVYFARRWIAGYLG
jgi:cadmium resistance protein CadD (predicted permease)